MTGAGDFDLSTEELRTVARFAVACARPALLIFEARHPGDPRPRAAVEAAQAFVAGAARSRRQRATAVEAHRAARQAATPAAQAAARAAGDAAAAAYLHPIARATQGGHILRPAAFAAHAAELAAGGDPAAAAVVLARAGERATPALLDVLRRYPPAPEGGNRVHQLWKALDTALRSRSRR